MRTYSIHPLIGLNRFRLAQGERLARRAHALWSAIADPRARQHVTVAVGIVQHRRYPVGITLRGRKKVREIKEALRSNELLLGTPQTDHAELQLLLYPGLNHNRAIGISRRPCLDCHSFIRIWNWVTITW